MGGTKNGPSPPGPPGDPKPDCPARLLAILPDPGGLSPGETLEIVLEGAQHSSVALLTISGVRLGTLAGLPELQNLIRCLRDGVPYRAVAERVAAGAVHCLLARTGP